MDHDSQLYEIEEDFCEEDLFDDDILSRGMEIRNR